MKARLTTGLGDIELELDKAKAPDTVANFIRYLEAGHYDGTIFHRVIKDFMIQCGGMDENMRNLSTDAPIKNEADNGLTNILGSVAMARTSAPHSASAQFFINTSDNHFLNHRDKTNEGWGYCVFGKVSDGMDVVRKIEQVSTGSRGGHQDVPEEIILIQKAVLI
ncbi:MAG: peptidylprolyl isomerase [Gammaproteobacteria bacterium]